MNYSKVLKISVHNKKFHYKQTYYTEYNDSAIIKKLTVYWQWRNETSIYFIKIFLITLTIYVQVIKESKGKIEYSL